LLGPLASITRLCEYFSRFVPPCLPTKARHPPTGGLWLHEINGKRVRLYSRNGHDFTDRFALIVEALSRLRWRSCILDGEAVACGNDGVPSFDCIRYRRHDASVFLYASDLIELNGDDLRREPLLVRKATPASVLAKAAAGLRLNDHLDHAEARSRLPTRAAWGWRASSRSAETRPTARGGRRAGSR
jgi:ATP-dependent DNA ligase